MGDPSEVRVRWWRGLFAAGCTTIGLAVAIVPISTDGNIQRPVPRVLLADECSDFEVHDADSPVTLDEKPPSLARLRVWVDKKHDSLRWEDLQRGRVVGMVDVTGGNSVVIGQPAGSRHCYRFTSAYDDVNQKWVGWAQSLQQNVLRYYTQFGVICNGHPGPAAFVPDSEACSSATRGTYAAATAMYPSQSGMKIVSAYASADDSIFRGKPGSVAVLAMLRLDSTLKALRLAIPPELQRVVQRSRKVRVKSEESEMALWLPCVSSGCCRVSQKAPSSQ